MHPFYLEDLIALVQMRAEELRTARQRGRPTRRRRAALAAARAQLRRALEAAASE
jgi:hypothetical protein